MHVSSEGINAAPLVVSMMWWMRQQTSAVVGSVKRQIVRAKEVSAGSVDHVIAVAAYRQSLPIVTILFTQSKSHIPANGDSDLQSAANKYGFYANGELDVKTFRDIEGVGERQINRPTAIEQRGALAPLKRHNARVL